MSASLQASKATLIACLLLWAPAALAQASPSWMKPLGSVGVLPTPPGPIAPLRLAQQPPQASPERSRKAARAQAARDLAFRYLDLWSAPNRVALATAASFYGPTLMFHGRPRTLESVLAEKRRVAERWPDRTYRYRPETTTVACETGGERCTVWVLFDFAAASTDRGRRSRGIGGHELVVSFSSGKPVIVSESSKVFRRGMTRFSTIPARNVVR